MPSKVAVVGSRIGLHARPAAVIASAASEFEDEITLSVGGADGHGVDATSSLLIMTLGAELGVEVTVESENRDAVDQIAALIEQDLDG
ncbi:HPr family phosphocarrier protein [Tessaracoccus sp. HDW20]|uniref:HPr family phosphocarrier protein n=1 Tax=Tessaracoccus coleopterorum TaxID=2714950 RepID=UPI0018D45A97|nr:HPr family phosphocarrier protein [Tessaracoccus coleopterorum]NHB84235.1 HPr family phosphocarrier protein [Tessaracoccus coleopterorum]